MNINGWLTIKLLMSITNIFLHIFLILCSGSMRDNQFEPPPNKPTVIDVIVSSLSTAAFTVTMLPLWYIFTYKYN